MASAPRITKRDLELPNKGDAKKIAFVLDNVFSLGECKKLIKMGRDGGFVPAAINVGYGEDVVITEYRKSGRCLIDTPETSGMIFDRIKDYLPKTFRGDKLVELNERLRFLKYTPGDFFLPHEDGQYVREEGKNKGHRSHLTVIVYLNEGCIGGETRFVAEDPADKEKKYDADTITEGTDMVPKTGSVLVFQHDILHQGVLLEYGVKYIIRTDAMFFPTNRRVWRY